MHFEPGSQVSDFAQKLKPENPEAALMPRKLDSEKPTIATAPKIEFKVCRGIARALKHHATPPYQVPEKTPDRTLFSLSIAAKPIPFRGQAGIHFNSILGLAVFCRLNY